MEYDVMRLWIYSVTTEQYNQKQSDGPTSAYESLVHPTLKPYTFSRNVYVAAIQHALAYECRRFSAVYFTHQPSPFTSLEHYVHRDVNQSVLRILGHSPCLLTCHTCFDAGRPVCKCDRMIRFSEKHVLESYF